MAGATEFVDVNTTEVVKVVQQGTGFALNAEGPNNGVIGKATRVVGGTFGVRGINLSTAGIALFGDARATTGATFGARGDSASTTGRGMFGFASAASGLTIGVRGVANSAQGTAGVFHNTAGGPILLGRASSVDLFSVDGSGNATATAFVGDGSGLTGIPSSVGGTVTSVDSGTGLTGGPFTTSGTLSFDTIFGDARYALASAFGDITAVIAGTGLSDGGIMGDVTLNLSPAARVRGITYLAGCDSCSILTDADDQRTIYVNLIGSMTIGEVTCFSDAGTPSINLQRDDGSPVDILSSDLVCSTSGATSSTFSGSENLLVLNDKLNFVMVSAGGTAKRATVVIKPPWTEARKQWPMTFCLMLCSAKNSSAGTKRDSRNSPGVRFAICPYPSEGENNHA